jgi:hypothetical protein
MAPFGLAGSAIAGYEGTAWLPGRLRTIAGVLLVAMVMSGVAAICFWIADGFVDSLLKAVRFVRWWCTGTIPPCAGCGGTGLAPDRSTAGLVVDYSLVILLAMAGSWYSMVALDRVLGR